MWPSPRVPCLLARIFVQDLSFLLAIYSEYGGGCVESGGGELPMEENLREIFESLSLS